MTSSLAGSTNVVLIPVKAFHYAKGRLEGALDNDTRSELAEAMATNLVRAQGDLPVAIGCDDPVVGEWAQSVGATTIWCPDTGLNEAVQHGVAELRDLGVKNVAIAHSDLPLAKSLGPLFGWTGVTLVPDRHRTGSNVIAFPTSIDFRFSYGAHSFQRHMIEAVGHRRGVRVVHDAELGWDVDEPADLDVADSDLLTNALKERGLS